MPARSAGAPTVDADALTSVAQACRDEERLRFGYTAHATGGRNAGASRTGWCRSGGRWYLVAYDLEPGRLAQLPGGPDPRRRPTGARFRPRDLPGGDFAAFVRAGVAKRPAGPSTVEALVLAPAAVVSARIGRWATVTSVDAGSCRVRLVADGFDSPSFALATVGADFRVIGPPGMVAQARDWESGQPRHAYRVSQSRSFAGVPVGVGHPVADGREQCPQVRLAVEVNHRRRSLFAYFSVLWKPSKSPSATVSRSAPPVRVDAGELGERRRRQVAGQVQQRRLAPDAVHSGVRERERAHVGLGHAFQAAGAQLGRGQVEAGHPQAGRAQQAGVPPRPAAHVGRAAAGGQRAGGPPRDVRVQAGKEPPDRSAYAAAMRS